MPSSKNGPRSRSKRSPDDESADLAPVTPLTHTGLGRQLLSALEEMRRSTPPEEQALRYVPDAAVMANGEPLYRIEGDGRERPAGPAPSVPDPTRALAVVALSRTFEAIRADAVVFEALDAEHQRLLEDAAFIAEYAAQVCAHVLANPHHDLSHASTPMGDPDARAVRAAANLLRGGNAANDAGAALRYAVDVCRALLADDPLIPARAFVVRVWGTFGARLGTAFHDHDPQRLADLWTGLQLTHGNDARGKEVFLARDIIWDVYAERRRAGLPLDSVSFRLPHPKSKRELHRKILDALRGEKG